MLKYSTPPMSVFLYTFLEISYTKQAHLQKIGTFTTNRNLFNEFCNLYNCLIFYFFADFLKMNFFTVYLLRVHAFFVKILKMNSKKDMAGVYNSGLLKSSKNVDNFVVICVFFTQKLQKIEKNKLKKLQKKIVSYKKCTYSIYRILKNFLY